MVDETRLSKTLSFWLRHDPVAVGLALNASGWTGVQDVLSALAQKGLAVDRERLEALVANNAKQRFEFSRDGTSIRARQGHSRPVDLGWPEQAPPAELFHGTVDRFLVNILADGLRPMKRHHVHLSPDIATAQTVGARRGKPIILQINTAEMAQAGHVFLLTSNGVWLTDAVPPQYLQILD